MSSQDHQPDAVYNSCPDCGGVIDVTEIGPFTKITCPHCSSLIRVRTQFDQFAIQSLIGEGGMSRVFAAIDGRLGRSTALKVLHQEYSRDRHRTAQFEREAKLTAGVSHPHVVKVYSFGRDQGYFYIAMEHVRGRSLEQMIRARGRLEEPFVLDLAVQVVGGLRAAYLEGLIHRDVKPGNILITNAHVAKLVDFGLAIFSEGEQDDSGEIWATPYYVPPEKLEGQPEDLRSDIYSLGATLFHALAGRPPFDANTNSLEELKRIKSRPVRLQAYAPKVSRHTAALIDRMMAREPDDRFQDYGQLLEALTDARSLMGTRLIDSSKQLLPWLKLSAGALALVAIGWLLVSILADSGPGDVAGPDPILGGNERSPVLTADGSTVSEKYVESRDALLERRFEDAEAGFRELTTLEGIRQPTLNWARFNAAVTAWITGDITEGRAIYSEILRDAAFSDDPIDAYLVRMFRLTGQQVAEREAFSEGLAEQLVGRPDLVPGLLALGFERWAAADLGSALGFLEEFVAASAGMSEHAMRRYRDFIDPYLNDLRLVEPWVERPPPDLSLEQAIESRNELAKARASLRTEGGPVHELVRARFEGLETRIRRQREMQAEAERRRLLRVTERELETLAELNESLDRHRASMDFPAAIKALEEVSFETPEARTARDGRLYLWKSAEQFVIQLLDDLANRPLDEPIMRRDGPPIQGRLVSAERQRWIVETIAGETRIPFAELDHGWLIRLATDFAETIRDSTEYYRRQEWIVTFAHVMGETRIAEPRATALMLENRGFRKRWLRVLEMSFGG